MSTTKTSLSLLPKLNGSVRQIAWAIDLRYGFVTALHAQISDTEAQISEAIASGDATDAAALVATRDEIERQAEIVLAHAVRAELWIDVLGPKLVTPDYSRGTGVNRMELAAAARRRNW